MTVIPSKSCSKTNFITTNEHDFGKSSNTLIEFTHMLWLAKRLNRTYLISEWMMTKKKQKFLHFFNTSLLESLYCVKYTLNEISTENIDIMEINTGEAYYAFQFFNNIQRFDGLVPQFNETILYELSIHFIQVYTSLWCCPSSNIIEASSWMLSRYFNNSLQSFTAVHKRSLDRNCDAKYNGVVNISNFSPLELAPYNTSKHASIIQIYPLCEMPIQFVHETQNLNNRSQQKIFVAFDGHGNITDYEKNRAIFGKNIKEIPLHRKIEGRELDMMMAIHADFAILNPKSTFSWQIYVLRECLGLKSVPKLISTDFYMHRNPHDFQNFHRHIELWVNWNSIGNACAELRKQIQ
jgi:hypothetical protein